MAELLGENADARFALAGRMPADLPDIIRSRPVQMPALLREASGLTAEQLRKLIEQARTPPGGLILPPRPFRSLIVSILSHVQARPPADPHTTTGSDQGDCMHVR